MHRLAGSFRDLANRKTLSQRNGHPTLGRRQSERPSDLLRAKLCWAPRVYDNHDGGDAGVATIDSLRVKGQGPRIRPAAD